MTRMVKSASMTSPTQSTVHLIKYDIIEPFALHASAMAEVPPEHKSMGLLARFVNRIENPRTRRTPTVAAAVAEYQKGDYLKPTSDKWTRHDQPTAAIPGKPVEVKFHRGFYRKPQAAINQDAERLRAEAELESKRESIESARLEAYNQHRQLNDFNIITGKGRGRENEDRVAGVKTVKQDLTEREKLTRYRTRHSSIRFYEVPIVTPTATEKDERRLREGLAACKETVVIGVPPGNIFRKVDSNGSYDIFGHTQSAISQLLPRRANPRNYSTLVLG